MRKISKTPGDSLVVGKIPKGCELCIKGEKLVLFATGICRQNCWYCTISKNRWKKDHIWANERLVKTKQEAIEEARLSNAKGMGITGGEPLLRPKRVAAFIEAFKKEFGSSFHIHLYTCGFTKPKTLAPLHKAGLDEIRIHLNEKMVNEALKYDWKVGMEIPAVPRNEKVMKQLVDYLDNAGAHFLNINELEFSERKDGLMIKKGLKLKQGHLTAVDKSEETAKKVLEYAKGKNLNVHYCTAKLKLNYQLYNRLRRRAENIKKPFEKVSKEGFLLKGVVTGNVEKIVKILNLPKDRYFVNKERKRIEISVEDAKKLAPKIEFNVAIVEEYPSCEPWDFELTPLNY